MVLASLFFTGMQTSARYGCARLPAFETVFVRGTLDMLVILPLILWKGLPIFGSNRRELFLRGTFGSISVAAIFLATLRIPLADASALFRMTPIFIPFVSAVILGERLKGIRIALSAIGFAGALLILRPGTGTLSLGGLMALGGAISNALSFVTVRSLSAKEHPLTIVSAFLTLSAAYSLIFAGHLFVTPTSQEWIFLLLVAACGGMGQYFMTRAFSYASATIITPWNYFEIVFSAIAGAVFLSQLSEPTAIFGIVLIVISALLINRT